MEQRDEEDWKLFAAIRKEELVAALHTGRVQVVNVIERPESGRPRSIAGSRHIPLSELRARMGELDPGREIVVYCASETCPLSREGARMLAQNGFHARVYEGGIEEWVASGLPTGDTGGKGEGGNDPDPHHEERHDRA